MNKDIEDYVKSCDQCQRRGRKDNKHKLHSIEVKEPFYCIGIDIVGPLLVTGSRNRYIVVGPVHITNNHFTNNHFTDTHFTDRYILLTIILPTIILPTGTFYRQVHFTNTHFTDTHFTDTHFTDITNTHFTNTCSIYYYF